MKEREAKARRHSFGALFLAKVFLVGLFSLIAGLFVISTPLAARLLFDHLQTYSLLLPSNLTRAAGPPMAIVILSAGRRLSADEFGDEFGKEALDGLSLERVRYGAFLARKTGLPILVSGGLPAPGEVPLAKLMAETLQDDYGVRAKWIEAQSTNTAENASLSTKLLRGVGIGRILLVTHAWHMKRSVAAFAGNGISVTPAPTAFYLPGRGPLWDSLTPSLTTLRMSGYAIHEIVGGVWYRVRYGY